MNQIAPTHIDQCFADEVPLLDFQLDDSPTFYSQLDTWSKRVKEGFDIFNGVAEAYKSVCNATTNLNNAWELMLEQFDRSSLFLSSDSSFAPYSTIINSMSSQMQEIQRYLKVRVDQMQDLTYNNLKKLAEERFKIESLDIQLKKTQETYFSALEKFGCTPAHDKNLVEFGESAMTSRRNYYILILKCVFSLRELYSSGIIEFSKNIIQDSLIHFTYFTNASNVYKNSEKEIGNFDSELRKAKIYCKSQIEADEKFHRMLRLEVTDKYNTDSMSIRKLTLNVPTTPKHNKYDFSQGNNQGSNSPVELLRHRQNSFESLRIKPHAQSDYALNRKSSSQEDVNRVNHRTVTAYTQNMTPGTGSKKSPVLQRARFNTVMIPSSDIEPEPEQVVESPKHSKLEHSNSNGSGVFRSKRMHKRFLNRINKRMSTLVKSSADPNVSAQSLDGATFRFSKHPSEDYNAEEASRCRLNSEATDSIPSIGTTTLLSPDQIEAPLEITSPYNVISTAIHRPPQEDNSFLLSEDYQKRVRPLHSHLKTGYLRQRPKGNFAIRTPKWPLVYCVIDKEEGWLRAGEMDGDGMYPLQNLMLSTVKKTDDVDRIHCFKVVSPELEVTLQAFTPKDYTEWIAGLNAGIQYTLHNNQVVKWKSVKKNRTNRLSIIVSGEKPVKQEEAIARIKGVSGNEICADCGKYDPDWTSSNLGVAVCIDCSGVHRSLGVHVSKIRSIALDSWTDTLLLFMENKGNIKMNENFEQSLDPALKPKPDSTRREKDIFITDKYVHLRFS